jgi:hypothetical protein
MQQQGFVTSKTYQARDTARGPGCAHAQQHYDCASSHQPVKASVLGHVLLLPLPWLLKYSKSTEGMFYALVVFIEPFVYARSFFRVP